MNMELDDLPPRYRAQAEQQLAARKRRATDPLAEAVKQVDPGMTIHDFRLVRGTTHTNLIFDAVLPFSSGKTTEQAAQEIRRLVKALDSTYFAVVTVEHSYTA